MSRLITFFLLLSWISACWAATTFTCPAYSAANTNSAQRNYASCQFQVCAASTAAVITSCGSGAGQCIGDQFIRLYQGSSQVSSNDDQSSSSNDPCSACSRLTVTPPSSGCATYTLRQGCYSSDSCRGQFAVIGGSSIDAPATVSPTVEIPFVVSKKPALTTRAPTQGSVPTVSMAPSRTPTKGPTKAPTKGSTKTPTRVPTVSQSSAAPVSGYEWRLDIPARFQVENNYGYCGEVSFIEAGLYYGQYFSQYDMRKLSAAASRVTTNIQSDQNSQLLLGVNDAQVASAIKLNYALYASGNDCSSGHSSRGLAWIKSQVQMGFPTVIGVYYNGASYSDYDHIVTVTQVNSAFNDTAYYASDILKLEDHGAWPNVVLTPTTSQYFFSFPFGSFQGTRNQANSGNQAYFLPSSTSTCTYAISLTGPVDNSSPKQLVPVRLATSINYENEIADGSNTIPAPLAVTLTITVGNSANPLIVGRSYTVYKYTSETVVPTRNFHFFAASASSKTVFTATTGTYTYTENIMSSNKVIYRALLT